MIENYGQDKEEWDCKEETEDGRDEKIKESVRREN
jgi:hypothetical protein